jgi:hypothetical protein
VPLPGDLLATGCLATSNEFCAWEVSRAPASSAGVDVRLDFRGTTGERPPARYAGALDAWQAPMSVLDRPLEW